MCAILTYFTWLVTVQPLHGAVGAASRAGTGPLFTQAIRTSRATWLATTAAVPALLTAVFTALVPVTRTVRTVTTIAVCGVPILAIWETNKLMLL